GVYLVLFRALAGDSVDGRPLWLRSLWRGLTLIGVFAAWVPFRAANLGQAETMLASMFLKFSFSLSYSVNFYLITLLCCCVCAAEPLLGRVLSSAATASQAEPLKPSSAASWYLFRPALQAALLLLFIVFDDQDTQFIYFQF